MPFDEDNILARQEARRNWERARHSAGIEDVLSVFSRKSADLLSFDQVKEQLRLSQKNYRGLQEIPLSAIRGSVGRYRDFTSTFLPRKDDMRDRWMRVNTVTFTRGAPPIEVYQVGDAYFVLDGNHRASVARQSGMDSILAHVWEFVTPVGLSEDADLDEVLIKAEYADFLDRTHLDRLRPEQDIIFTTPGHYRELEYQIALFRQVLEQIDGEPFSYEDAVTAWYDMIYTPAVQIVRERGLLERFPNRTEADLFVWVWRHNQELQARGIASLAQAADEVGEASRPFLARVWRSVVSRLRQL
jgi:hypothetical protein